MAKLDVALLTCSRFPKLQKDYWPLLDELSSVYKLEVKPVVWNDDDVDWKTIKNIVICSTWDYCESLGDFTEFLNRTAEYSNIINSPSIIHWNIDKSYLNAFKNAEIPVIDTLWLDEDADFDEIEKFLGRRIVIKPAVGAGSSGMKGFILESKDNLSEAKEYARLLSKNVTAMVQPYLKSADSHGECALVLFGGKLSHAAHRPVAGHQGTPDQEVETASYVEASENQKEIASKVATCLPSTPAYLRVDFLKDDEGGDVVLEAEMIEPTLFLEVFPQSIKTYAQILVENHIIN